MIQLNATRKGLLTGAAMIILTLLLYYTHLLDSPLTYLVYIIYSAGIIWSLTAFSKNTDEKKFSSFFSEGFKCFVIVTLMIVIFTWIFYKLYPEMISDMVEAGRKEMMQQKDYTPAEINEMSEQAQKYAVTMLTSVTIIKYLILGALITALSGFFIIKRAN